MKVKQRKVSKFDKDEEIWIIKQYHQGYSSTQVRRNFVKPLTLTDLWKICVYFGQNCNRSLSRLHTVWLGTFSGHGHIMGKAFFQIPIWMCLITHFCLNFAVVSLNPPVISLESHNFDFFARFLQFLAILAIFGHFWLFLEAF